MLQHWAEYPSFEVDDSLTFTWALGWSYDCGRRPQSCWKDSLFSFWVLKTFIFWTKMLLISKGVTVNYLVGTAGIMLDCPQISWATCNDTSHKQYCLKDVWKKKSKNICFPVERGKVLRAGKKQLIWGKQGSKNCSGSLRQSWAHASVWCYS